MQSGFVFVSWGTHCELLPEFLGQTLFQPYRRLMIGLGTPVKEAHDFADSPFGMMELTRQRVGPGLKRTVFNTCAHCEGAGLSRTVQSKALAVLRDVRAILNLKGFSVLQLFVAPAVNDFLVNQKRRTLLDLEEEIGKRVMVKAEQSYPVDVVHYRFLTADGQEANVVIPAGLGVRL